MKRSTAQVLGRLGMAAAAVVIGVLLLYQGGGVEARYALGACSDTPFTINVPGVSISNPATIDGSPGARTCALDRRRTDLGTEMEFVGVGMAVAGLLALGAVARWAWRGRRRRRVNHPVRHQARSVGAALDALGAPLYYVGVAIVLLGAVGFIPFPFAGLWSPFRPVSYAVSGSSGGSSSSLLNQAAADGLASHMTLSAFDLTYTFDYLELWASGLVALLIGRVVWRRGERHLAPSAVESQAEDPRPPVLYLRSFAADRRMRTTHEGAGLLDAILSISTAEEELTHALQTVGPVVALGVPGEKLPPLGAARAYTSDEHWQTHVSGWVEASRVIVMLVGTTESFWWEVDHVVSSGALAKTCMLFPADQDGYSMFRSRLHEHVHLVSLPEVRPAGPSHFGIGGVLFFGPDGSADVRPLPSGPMTKLAWLVTLGPVLAE